MTGIGALRAGGGGDGRAPGHVAIIMDGNGRWAQSHGMPRTAGHRQGAEAVRRTVRAAGELGIPYLTLYGFSSENWKRPVEEVLELMGLLRFYLRHEVGELNANGVRIRVVGERERLDSEIVAEIERAEALTAHNDALHLSIAVDYGGRREIVCAARDIARRVAAGTLDPAAIDETTVAGALFTRDIPDPDLLIRTGGETRISNFLLWQCAYAELLFLDVQWPEFGKAHLERALQDFQGRERRWGNIG